MVGTDITDYDTDISLPENIKLLRQNIFDEWPAEMEGYFDLVNQRAVLAHARSFENAVAITQRLTKLVKPGGWIQLVDGCVRGGELHASDKPSEKMWKTMGNFLTAFGMDATFGSRLSEILKAAGGVANVSSKNGSTRLGAGANQKMTDTSFVQIQGLKEGMGQAFQKMPDPPIPFDEWIRLMDQVMEEAVNEGFDIVCYAAWAQRV